MCGRFAFYSPREAVLAVFGVDLAFEPEPRWNIAPTQTVAAIRARAGGGPEGAALRWGLVPSWAKDTAIGHRLINARAETLGARPAFREAWARRRCVVLANGFYEWRRDESGRTPYYATAPDQRPLALAGLWEAWAGGRSRLETCTIITTDANRKLGAVHDRMPVILAPEAVADWIDPERSPETVRRWLRPAAEDLLELHEVGRAVNSPANEGARLIAPVTAPSLGQD